MIVNTELHMKSTLYFRQGFAVLLHSHWLLFEEGGWDDIGWQLHSFLNVTESCTIVNIYELRVC